jgi:tRNA-Thr(GGU) m(6)t(6)A37 methyltransferase TsaA
MPADPPCFHAPDAITCQPIGIVRSRFTAVVGMPIQAAAVPEETAMLELLPAFAPGLRDIEGFDYLVLITHMHLCEREPLEVTPFLDDRPHGVFATRAPARPNRLGLSIVRLLRVEGCTLHFAGNDMVDGTPVLDIKPYVPRFDVRATERIGWFADRLDALPAARADGRMS